jgi:sugar/nucleoside kinase (ribokinase family)
MNKKVICVGNALTDVIKVIDNDNVLTELGLPKGSMQMVDADVQKRLLDLTKRYCATMVSGGSAANTAYATAKLGVDTAYVGLVGTDDYGDFYIKDLEQSGVRPIVSKSSDSSTGVALTFVSQDGERTFATNLGAALGLNPSLLKEEDFKSYDYVHIEGYLVYNQPLVEAIFNIAEANGLKTSIDLASYNVVVENKDFMTSLCKRANIIFANQDEAFALTNLDADFAAEEISSYCDIAVVKMGERGSIISTKDEIIILDADAGRKKIDTTGAGDMYAGGFLAALCQGLDLRSCGKWGTIVAGSVIEVLGTKMDAQCWAAIHDKIAAQ